MAKDGFGYKDMNVFGWMGLAFSCIFWVLLIAFAISKVR